MFNSSSRFPALCCLVLLVSASGASCPKRFQSPADLSPVAFTQPPSLPQIVAVINANSQRVQRLEASGARLNISGLPSLKASLALERPLRFRMQAGLGLTGTELDLGSNDDLFWMWAKRNDPPGIYYARHAEFNSSAAKQILPLPPQWLIEALGLVQLDPNGAWEGPFPRGVGRVEIRNHVATSSEQFTKTYVVDDRRGLILEQHVYDGAGQLLATALASQHTYDPSYGVSLPRQVDIQLPPAQLAFTLEVDSYLLNQLSGDPAQLWSMPQMPGVQPLPLASVAPPAAAAPLVTARGVAGWQTGAEFMPGAY